MSNLLNFLTLPDPFIVGMPADGETKCTERFEVESSDGRYYFVFDVDVSDYVYNGNQNPELDDYDTCDHEVSLIELLNEDDEELKLSYEEKKQIENNLFNLIES